MQISINTQNQRHTHTHVHTVWNRDRTARQSHTNDSQGHKVGVMLFTAGRYGWTANERERHMFIWRFPPLCIYFPIFSHPDMERFVFLLADHPLDWSGWWHYENIDITTHKFKKERQNRLVVSKWPNWRCRMLQSSAPLLFILLRWPNLI